MEEIEEKKVGKHHLLKRIIIVLLFIIILSFVYMRYIATSGFIVKEYNLTSEKLPIGFDGFKIAHLSDIHYSTVGYDNLNNIVSEVNIMKPNIIVFTGDLYDEYSNLSDDMKERIIESLSKLDAKLGKFAVSGNHDYDYEGYEELIEKCGFKYLSNESELIYYNDETPIEIVGYPSYLKDTPNYDIEVSNNFKIALIHEGDAVENILNKNFEMVLAGHSHGNQINIALIKDLFKTDGAKKYYDNYYEINDTKLYISSGIGETKYPLRAFNKRSFNFYRLYIK